MGYDDQEKIEIIKPSDQVIRVREKGIFLSVNIKLHWVYMNSVFFTYKFSSLNRTKNFLKRRNNLLITELIK